MHRIIDLLSTTIILLSILYLGKEVVHTLGGGISLIVLCGFLYFISSTFKSYKLQFSLLILLVICIIFINYLAYVEINNLWSIEYLVGAWYILNLIIVFLFIYLCFSLTQLGGIQTEDNPLSIVEIQKKVLEPIVLLPIIASTFLLITGLNLRSKLVIIEKSIPILATLSTIWIIVGFVAIIFTFNKIINDKYLFCLMDGNKKILISNYKVKFILCFLIILVIGCGAEIFRGYWLIWFETYFLLLAMVFANLKISKHIFQTTSYDTKELNTDEIISVMKNSKYLFILLFLNIIILFTYDVVLSEFFRQ